MQRSVLSATDLGNARQDEPAQSTAGPGNARPALAAARRNPRQPDWTDGWMWPAALAIALFAHAAVIFAVIRQPDVALAGGGGQQVDAISVTMVHSEVLEAREPVRPEPASASAAASVESTDGAPQSVATAAAEQQEEKKVPPEEQQDKPKEEPVRDAEAVLETPRESQRQQKKQAAAAPPTGGAAARSDTASEARANAPAAASPGAVREYALYVAQALAKSKPKGSGGHGTVRVKFVISGDGGLSTVQVSSTSGSSKLDNIAIGAVRQTKFLVPPAGMTALQLTYEVPYHFR